MLVPFETLPNNSRVWIYPSNRKFTDEEIKKLDSKLTDFLNQWNAHGSALEVGFEIKYNRFIIIGLNQNLVPISGCSIDASVNFIQQLEKEFEVTLLDKMNVTYYSGSYIAYKPLKEFKVMAKEKAVSLKTIVFDNLVNTKAEYIENWEVQAAYSWHARFM